MIAYQQPFKLLILPSFMDAKGNRKDYEKYRWFFTSSDKLVIGGKNAEQNEEIVKNANPQSILLHTAAPGSPFCIIQNPSETDLEEAAVFTACFGQEWKRGKAKIEVHIFSKSQIKKTSSMKAGTFGITGSIKKKTVAAQLYLDFQKGKKLRSLPKSAAKKPLAVLTPGKLSKDEAAEIIKKIIIDKVCYPIKKEEILSAIPSDKISVKEL